MSVSQVQPEVSVVVLSYNQRYTVARAMDSILEQQCAFAFEVVVSDDGSSDGTRELLEKYARDYPDVVRLLPAEPNRGIVENYFHALSHCRGKYIADCAGDDYWLTRHRLQDMWRRLDGDDSLSLVFTGWTVINRASGCSRDVNTEADGRLRAPVVPGRTLLTALLGYHNPLPAHLSAALYRVSVLRKALDNYPEMVKNAGFACEDLPVLAALLASGDAAYIEGSSLAYTVGHVSATSEEDMRRVASFHLATLIASIRLARHYGVPIALLRHGMARKAAFVMAQAFNLHDRTLRRDIDSRLSEYGVPVSWHYRLLYAITAINPVWTMAVTLNRMLHR